MTAILSARLDGEGRLIEAEGELAALNLRAGGAVGAPLALAPLARVVRLAQRLDIVVGRAVTVADGDGDAGAGMGADIELWARARPEAGGVRLTVSGWHRTHGWRPRRGAAPDVPVTGDWRWETDAALRLTVITPAAGIAHGFDAFALLGKPLTALFAFGDHEEAMLPLLRALASGSALLGQPARLRGSGRGVTLSATFRVAPAGGFAGFRGSVQMAEETPPSLAGAVADRLDDALRRPLARIVDAADGLAAEEAAVLPAGYAGYAGDIAQAGRHLMGLVDDVAEMRAIDRPDFALPVVAIDLVALASRAAALCARGAGRRGVTVDLSPAAAQVSGLGDARRVVQVLVNLIGNAARYAPAGGRVAVTARIDGGRACVTVADDGPGIAAADQARIFGKFERVDPLEPGGTGLGLYIARRLARAMGGELTVESAPGAGARFTLELAAALA